jgi:chromosome segregation ATPase
LTKSLNLRDQELFELEENVDYYSKTLKQCDGYKNELLEENEKIMNDLKVLGRENQIMNLEFQKLSTENQTMQTYEKESQEDLERLHIIIADQKEQIYDIQLKYRGLILEFENTKQQARQCLSMLDEEKLKSVSKTKIMESLYSQIDIFQQDLETRNLEFLRVEKEITNLTRVLHTLEKQSKLITSENETLKKALYDQRDILQIGNHEYKDVQNQKYKLQIENESLKKEFREFQIEIQRLENCCEDERLKVDKLNNVLNVERQKSFESQIKLEEVMKSKSFVELKLRGVQNDDQNELEKMKLENQRLGVLVGSLRVEDPQLRVEDEIERELKDTRDRKISLQASDLSNKSVSRSNSEHGSNDAHVGSVASMDTMGNQDLFADRKGVFDDRLLETIINSKNETPK